MTPTNKIEPAALFSLLIQAPRPHKELPFPRNDTDGKPIGTYFCWVLTQNEQIAAGIAAADATRAAMRRSASDKSALDDAAGRLTYTDYLCAEQLWRACRSIEDIQKPLFPSPAEMRKWLTVAECENLYEQYLDTRAELGVSLDTMGPAEADAWCEKIEAGAGAQLPFFSAANANQLLRRLADRSTKSPTEPGSPGAPPDGLTFASEESSMSEHDSLPLESKSSTNDEDPTTDLEFSPAGDE